MKRAFRLASVLALVLPCVACSGPRKAASIAPAAIQGSEFKSIMAFDLQEDSRPSAAFVLHEIAKPDAAPSAQTVLLPFPSGGMEDNTELLTTSSSISGCCSLVSFFHMPDGSGTFSVPLSPSFSAQPDDLSSLPGQLYLLRLGQERRFIYKYDVPRTNQDVQRLLSVHLLGVPDAVAVAVPKRATPLEVRDQKTESPARKASYGDFAFYPGSSEEAATDHLELRYLLPLNSSQELVVNFVVKLVATIAAPLAILIFLDLKDKRKRRVKLVVLVILVVFELSALSVVGYLAWDERTSQSVEAVFSAIVIVIGLALSLLVAYLKKNAENDRGELVPDGVSPEG